MKYTKEQKIAWAKRYLNGGTVDSPPSFKGKRNSFQGQVRKWATMLQNRGESYFECHYRKFAKEEKLEVVAYAVKHGLVDASIRFGIDEATIYAWVRRFRTQGPDGLKCKPKGRPPKMPKDKPEKTVPKTAGGCDSLEEARIRIAELEAELNSTSSEREKALSTRVKELEAELSVAEKEREEAEIRVDFLKKLKALTEKDRKKGR